MTAKPRKPPTRLSENYGEILEAAAIANPVNAQLLACDFAEYVAHIYEATFKDNRPRKAIEAKLLYLKGEITAKELDEARENAYSGVEDAHRAVSHLPISSDDVPSAEAYSAKSAVYAAQRIAPGILLRYTYCDASMAAWRVKRKEFKKKTSKWWAASDDAEMWFEERYNYYFGGKK